MTARRCTCAGIGGACDGSHVPTCPAFPSCLCDAAGTPPCPIHTPNLAAPVWQTTQPRQQSVPRTPPAYPCTCREPAAPYVTHSTLGPCYVTAPPEPTITADQWLAASCRDCACPGECERLWAENVRRGLLEAAYRGHPGADTPNAYGSCPLCRKAFERDEQTIEVLMNGGDAMGPHLCVACAMDRPTVLIPALRPVGFYARNDSIDEHDPVAEDRCPHSWVPAGAWPGEVEHCGLCDVDREREETPTTLAGQNERLGDALANVRTNIEVTFAPFVESMNRAARAVAERAQLPQVLADCSCGDTAEHGPHEETPSQTGETP